MENASMLHTEPSFCIYAEEDGSQNEKGDLGTISSDQLDNGEFSFAERSMRLIVEDEEDEKSNEFKNEQVQPPSPKMYLATGFGIDGIGGMEFNPTTFNESGDLEEYYKIMVSQEPCDPLFLKNYAQLLQSKGDLTGAENYYLRATQEDPNDGESLMQYAKLVWEVYGEKDKALSYFERAVLVANGDSNILAAYASFMWEIDEDSEHGGPKGISNPTLKPSGGSRK